VKQASAAVTPVYDAPFNIRFSGRDAADVTGQILRRQARVSAPKAPKPAVGFDPRLIINLLSKAPPINECDVKDLTVRLIVTARLTATLRAVDVISIPWSQSRTRFSFCNHDHSELLSVTFAMYDTKQSSSKKADVERSLWTENITIFALSAVRIENALQIPRDEAATLAERCCLVRTLHAYTKLRERTHPNPPTSLLGSSRVFSRSLIVQARDLKNQPSLSSVPPRQYKAASINKFIQTFMLSAGLDKATTGTDHPFSPKHWRHVSASILHHVGKADVAKTQLQHSSDKVFHDYYQMQVHPDFKARWEAIAATPAGQALTAWERFLV